MYIDTETGYAHLYDSWTLGDALIDVPEYQTPQTLTKQFGFKPSYSTCPHSTIKVQSKSPRYP